MDVKQVENVYKQHSLSSLPPRKLILWMVEEASKALGKGKRAIEEKNKVEQNKQIQITQQLILEIIPLVNSSIETGKILTAILDFMNRRLIEANIKQDSTILEEIESLLLQFKLILIEEK